MTTNNNIEYGRTIIWKNGGSQIGRLRRTNYLVIPWPHKI